jgi:hypothetical protein
MLSFDFHSNAFNTPIDLAMQLEREERPKFMAMQEVFWVKVSCLAGDDKYSGMPLTLVVVRLPGSGRSPRTSERPEDETTPNRLLSSSSHNESNSPVYREERYDGNERTVTSQLVGRPPEWFIGPECYQPCISVYGATAM